MAIQNSLNKFGVCKWIVNPTPGLGTHTTIASAIVSASSGDDIFITAGTYTENLTLKAGVNLTAFSCDSQIANFTVTVVGKLTASFSGNVNISNINFQTNSDYSVETTGSNTLRLAFYNCNFYYFNNNSVHLNNSNSLINMYYCTGTPNSTFTLFDNAAGVLQVSNSGFGGISSTANSTCSGGGANFGSSSLQFGITCTGTGFVNGDENSTIGANNITALVIGGASGGGWAGTVNAGTATPVTIATGLIYTLSGTLGTSNSSAVSGLGTLDYSGLLSTGTLSASVNTASGNYYTSGVSFDGGSNVLNTYTNKTTWTPVVVGTSTAGTGTYSIQFGSYMRIGKLIVFVFRVVTTAHTGTGNIQINGFPFSSNMGTGAIFPAYTSGIPPAAGNADFYCYLSDATSSANIVQMSLTTGNQSGVAIQAAMDINVSGMYYTS